MNIVASTTKGASYYFQVKGNPRTFEIFPMSGSRPIRRTFLERLHTDRKVMGWEDLQEALADNGFGIRINNTTES